MIARTKETLTEVLFQRQVTVIWAVIPYLAIVVIALGLLYQKSDTDKDQDALIQYNQQYNLYQVDLLANVTCLDRAERLETFRNRELIYIELVRGFGAEEEAKILEANLELNYPADADEDCPVAPTPPTLPGRLND